MIIGEDWPLDGRPCPDLSPVAALARARRLCSRHEAAPKTGPHAMVRLLAKIDLIRSVNDGQDPVRVQPNTSMRRRNWRPMAGSPRFDLLSLALMLSASLSGLPGCC